MSGDRKKDFNNIMKLVVSTVIVTVFFGYLFLTGERDLTSVIIGCVFVFGSLIWTIAEAVMYRNKYFKPEDKDKTAMKSRKGVEKRKAMLKKTMQGKDMYDICKKFMLENTLSYAVLAFIILGLFSFVMFIRKGDRIYRMFCVIFGVSAEGGLVFQPAFAVFIWYAILPVLGSIAFYIYLRVSNKAVKKLKQVMEQSEYDKMRVNDDFMVGSKHHLEQGLLHIGPNYVVLCEKTSCMVCEVHDVTAVKKIVELQKNGIKGLEAENQFYFVLLQTKKGGYKLRCMDEIAADLIVEEFKQHGIFEEEVKAQGTE